MSDLKPQNKLHNTGRTHWPKGKSGNPGGRPKGLASLVRSKTKDGQELVALMLKIMRGTLTATRPDADGNPYEAEPSIKERIQAIEWLADRGFGKSPMSLELTGADGKDFYPPELIEAAAALKRQS